MELTNIRLTVNGTQRAVRVDVRQTLLDVLREESGLTEKKYGGGTGQCGACTVLVDGNAVHACMTLAGDLANKSVTTIEGLAKGEVLHPVQAAFLAEGAFQCGYCTAGMVMGAVALLSEKPRPTDAEIVAGMNGHICRCGGYAKQVEAVKRAAGEMGEVKP